MTSTILLVPPSEVLGWILLSTEAKDIAAQYPHRYKGAVRPRTTKWVSDQRARLRNAYGIDVTNDHLLLVEAARRGLLPPTPQHPHPEFAALGAAIQQLQRKLYILPAPILQTMNSLAAGHLLTRIAARPDLSGAGKLLSQSALTTRCTEVAKSLGLFTNIQLFAAALLAGLLDVDIPRAEETISLVAPGTTKLNRGSIKVSTTARVTLPGSIVVIVKGPPGSIVHVSSGGVSREIVVGGGSTDAPVAPEAAPVAAPTAAPVTTAPVAAPPVAGPEPAQPDAAALEPAEPVPTAVKPAEPPKDPILAAIQAATLSPHGEFLLDETTEQMINLHWMHVVGLVRTGQLEPPISLAPFISFLRDNPPTELAIKIFQAMADGMSNTKIDSSLGFRNGSNRKQAILAARAKLKVRPDREKVAVVVAMLAGFVH